MKLVIVGLLFSTAVLAEETNRRPPLPDSCLPNGDRDQCILRVCDVLPISACEDSKNLKEVAKLCKVQISEFCIGQ